jgi:hypothetical protein
MQIIETSNAQQQCTIHASHLVAVIPNHPFALALVDPLRLADSIASITCTTTDTTS